jgi:hypothetical protein
MLIEGLLSLLLGIGLGVFGLRSARRHGLLTPIFWQSFPAYAGYRIKHLYGLGAAIAGILLIGWGGSLLFRSILAFYAARLGHVGP